MIVAVLVILVGGSLSFYYSNQLLSATEAFVDKTLPSIETANSLEQTVVEIGNLSRALVGSDTVEELSLINGRLNVQLQRLEAITARISHGEGGFDLLRLNWLSQAIRTLVQQIFQLEVHRLEIKLHAEGVLGDIRAQLLAETMPYTVAAKVEGPTGTFTADPQFASVELLRGSLLKMVTISSQLQLANNSTEIDELEEAFGVLKEVYKNRLAAAPQLASTESLHQTYIYDMEMLYGKYRKYQRITGEVASFTVELDKQVKDLAELASESVDHVFGHFHEAADKVMEKERIGLYLTTVLTLGAILLLHVLYRRFVVSGFSDRLNLISSAMVAESGGEPVNIPQRRTNDVDVMSKAVDDLLAKAVRLRNLAAVDQLTQVWNRRQFLDLAAIEADRSTRRASTSVIMMLDIDHFKNVNDTYGHSFGDLALYEVAQNCKHSIRSIDIFARYGGEEFSLLMPDTSLGEGVIAAERIRNTIASRPLQTKSGKEVFLTVSIGVAEIQLNEVDIHEALGLADRALYFAKNMGRNRVEVFGTATGSVDGKDEMP